MLRRLFRVSLRRSHDIVSETDEEIRFHIAARVDRLMADGMSRDAAEAEAWRLFGPSESRAIVIAAAQRREETLSMFERFDAIRSDVWYALRQLRRAPLFTAAAVASLAIGIGANAMMFGVIDRLLLRQRPGVVAPEQIFSIGEMRHSGRGEYRTTTFSYPTYKDYRDLESLEQIAVALWRPHFMPAGSHKRRSCSQGNAAAGRLWQPCRNQPLPGPRERSKR